MRLLAVLCLLVMACRRQDPVAAEVKEPVSVVLRVHQTEKVEPCTETGLARVKCWFRSEPRACAYLEIGAVDEDSTARDVWPVTPEAVDPPEGCDLHWTLHRLRIGRVPWPREELELAEDSTGARLAYRLKDKDWYVLYFLDGTPLVRSARLAGPGFELRTLKFGRAAVHSMRGPTTPPIDPIDWSKVPELEIVAPELVALVDPSLEDLVLDYVRRTRGADGIVEILLRRPGSPTAPFNVEQPNWQELFDTLDASHQARVITALVDQLDDRERSGLNEPVFAWLVAHPASLPADFDEALVKLFSSYVDGQGNLDGAATILDELARRNDPRAGELACRALESTVVKDWAPSDGPFAVAETNLRAAAYRSLIANHTPCRWVGLELARNPCRNDYRCDGQARPDGEAVFMQHPLCTAREVDAFLHRDAGEDDPTEAPQGLLLLGAAYARNSVSPEVVKRNARRQYRYLRPDPAGSGERSPCNELSREPELLVCSLPIDVKDVRVEGCHVSIDDSTRTVRLEDLSRRLLSDQE